MTANLPKLVLAAVLAASVPSLASARDCDRFPAAARPAPAPHPWRASWRARELREIRAELRALDRERAWFHARHAGHPGKLRRYDRAWLERRAALERRLVALSTVAWR